MELTQGDSNEGSARQWVWLSNLDQAVEDIVKHCEECQQDRANPPPVSNSLHPWQWPTRPWTRLHVDFAGLMDGKMFLIIIDSHSKWIEVECYQCSYR